ncbi:MAG: hypothetical protein A2848_01750 [Candidatus Magasanikbacteria bacterium RIFCSPHIGHO2_01_FULL_50_8]|uniref:DUF5666 domain-containing protein n=2 Tax=Candidatus Magasanikiibacteriota TaxID=1752731 RepID=A0A1F6LVH0_9BACT|nr:MAG: hypothetical protein A2848_01750 [Candidatus Magasanikbacteria bacterium RIFCSPHIGHO2_01_FULL_50_8]OGH68235.1 MAG: hypothetical protein A3C15_01270 [Candidatus Magasanikbacteria bacterium RIFCSPHIGHO2_02_FULL_50_9b]
MNKKIVLVSVCGSVVIAAVLFWAGMQYAKKESTSLRAGMSGRAGQFRARGGGTGATGGEFLSGEILSADEKSITITLQNGGSKIIFFSSSTSVGKTVQGTVSDLSVGSRVTVNGSAANDGTVTAEMIQLRQNEIR